MQSLALRTLIYLVDVMPLWRRYKAVITPLVQLMACHYSLNSLTDLLDSLHMFSKCHLATYACEAFIAPCLTLHQSLNHMRPREPVKLWKNALIRCGEHGIEPLSKPIALPKKVSN